GAFITKCVAQLMRDFGASPAPMNAFLLNFGLESLHLRMKRHCENAQKVAEFLESRQDVAWVNYAGLKSSPYYELAQKYMPNGTCGVVSFGLVGGRDAAEVFMSKLQIAQIATHVADARTCVLHPANATHRQLSEAELEACGVGPDLIRLSCGIEDADDLIADLAQALETK
ncbi:MAG: O-acetylhomoserine aminocarboxypropyltransferase/cysteine synthase, partial [Thermoguttaceae bacterium]|nr:O-acetylhomoserine aminocarboxypropyltransferase/cysteine synthase [Thermoguttaceae bacterium]